MNSLRELFLLDPEVVFLNHGSFGATPKPVFEVYQQWQRRLERQPVQFLGYELGEHLAEARTVLANYIHADKMDVVFVPNATYGVNIIAHSLKLMPGDEILGTSHEYGACAKAWQFRCQRAGATYIAQPIALPVETPEEIVEQVWQGVTPRTKLIFLSHITSATALRLPIEELCRRAREAGILTLVDGAHAPGQIPLDMGAIGADFYTGNAHKWLMSAKGAAFLHVRPEHQSMIEPLIISWGWGTDAPFDYGSTFLNNLQWAGTVDPAAFFSVPAAIQFQADHHWTAVGEQCHALLTETLHRLYEVVDLPPLYPDHKGFYHQLAIAPLPPLADLNGFKKQLYDRYKVEIPCFQWQERQFIRPSFQGYNTPADADALVKAVAELLPSFK